MTPEELAIILENHKKWLNSEGGEQADLQEANLRWANLQGANLRWANLRWANLQEANLQEADLRGANLQKADLRGANLQEANLRGANLQEANLQEANLQEADLRGANLQKADLRGADLRGADLDFSGLPLWCGLFGVKVDARLFSQMAYHLCRMEVPEELEKYQDALREIAKQFHRFDECGGLPEKKAVEP